MNPINRFLTMGDLGPLKIGMASADVTPLLGLPDRVGKGIAGALVLAFGGRSLQLTERKKQVILIAIYFDSTPLEGWPRALGVEIPFSKATTLEAFQAYLARHGVPLLFSSSSDLGGNSSLRVGQNVIACFENGFLRSLQAS